MGSSPDAGVFQLQREGALGWESLLHLAGKLNADPRVLQATASGLVGTDRLPRTTAPWPTTGARRATPSGPGTWDGYARDAWASVLAEAEQTTMAVLGAGFDQRHEDLTFVEVLGTSRLTNDLGHSTHFAALACADADNGVGVAGLGWHRVLRVSKVIRSYLSWAHGSAVRVDGPSSTSSCTWPQPMAPAVNLSLGHVMGRDAQTCTTAVDQSVDTPPVLVRAVADDTATGDSVIANGEYRWRAADRPSVHDTPMKQQCEDTGWKGLVYRSKGPVSASSRGRVGLGDGLLGERLGVRWRPRGARVTTEGAGTPPPLKTEPNGTGARRRDRSDTSLTPLTAGPAIPITMVGMSGRVAGVRLHLTST